MIITPETSAGPVPPRPAVGVKRLIWLRSLLAYPPVGGREAVKHMLRVLTLIAKASFWAVCLHYFGPEALLKVAAAWFFVLGIKDLTFARVRLSNMARPEKRRTALIKSIILELAILLGRTMLILFISQLLFNFDQIVSEIVSSLMISALFWGRETLVTLARVYHVVNLSKYATFSAAVSGLAAVIVFAHAGMGAVDAVVGALITREIVQFLSCLLIAIIGGSTSRFRHIGGGDSDEEDEDSGANVPVIGSDGKEISSAFKIFIGDNVVYSRWRALQFCSRVVAAGLMGPFGGIITRLFFAYRRPSPYVHAHQSLRIRQVVLLGFAFVLMLGLAVIIAGRFGLLQAFGLAASAFAFRLAALTANVLLWSRLSVLVGQNVPVPTFMRRRTRD